MTFDQLDHELPNGFDDVYIHSMEWTTLPERLLSLWNAFIHVAAREARLEWKGPLRRSTR
jgi:hypothetical protein